MMGYSGVASEKERGFILVTVLWALLLLALLAIVATTMFRGSHQALTRADKLAAARTLADGMARLLVADIAATRRFRFNGMAMRSGWPIACRHENAVIVLTATNSVGLVDLNLAKREVLKTLLLAGGVTMGEVERLLDAIIDFRDPDHLTRDGQPEDRIYSDRGELHLPKNSPYEDVGELDQVAYMKPRVLARIRPYLTVYSRRRTVDFSLSPPKLATMFGGDALDDAQIATRSAEASRTARDTASAYHLEAQYRTFEIRVLVARDDGMQAMRMAGVEMAPGTRDGYRLLYWNRAMSLPHERLLAGKNNLPPCFPSLSRE